MTELKDYFTWPYVEGYVRCFGNKTCYYISEKEFKKIILEDLDGIYRSKTKKMD